ncbi:MAG: hypothetical protein GX202_02625 [Firmicutes bacterium]|nr:hypothetical protein [Bacillota bacterium]
MKRFCSNWRSFFSILLILVVLPVVSATEPGGEEPGWGSGKPQWTADRDWTEEDEDRAWMEVTLDWTAAAAPEEDSAADGPQWIVETGPTLWYGLSPRAGFLVSFDAGITWETRNEGLPGRLSTGMEQPALLTAIGVDPVQPQRVAVTTTTQIYLSEDCGATWRRIPFNNGSVITTVALAPGQAERMMVGTSFAGIYETTNAGRNWTKLSGELSFLQQAPYEEEIAALAYHPENPDKLVLACGFGNGLYLYNKALQIWEALEAGARRRLVKNLLFRPVPLPATTEVSTSFASPSWWLQITYDDGQAIYSWPAFELIALATEPRQPLADRAKAERMALAAGKYGIYVRSDFAAGRQLDDHIRFIKKNGLNAMVVDFKDDMGYITYDTGVAFAHQIGAVQKRFAAKTLIKKAKENGIYLIGRLVVFKDSRLYRYDNHRYAVWDRNSGGPWRDLVATETDGGETTYVQREHWVDPYAREVWEYNLAIAEELQALGVDEIQFDYIRFPTDGDLSRCYYRYQPPDARRIDALEGFLALARSRLRVPISADLYGYHCWYLMEGLTGQNIRIFAQYVDVICPMFYPSHFPNSFYPVDYLERAEYIYREGSFRAQVLTGGECLIRPYVQAFRLTGRELRMTAPVYTEYLIKQVTGTVASPASGFTLWNNSNDYYMVKRPLTDIIYQIDKEREIQFD